jgi:hypothetical protein
MFTQDGSASTPISLEALVAEAEFPATEAVHSRQAEFASGKLFSSSTPFEVVEKTAEFARGAAFSESAPMSN